MTDRNNGGLLEALIEEISRSSRNVDIDVLENVKSAYEKLCVVAKYSSVMGDDLQMSFRIHGGALMLSVDTEHFTVEKGMISRLKEIIPDHGCFEVLMMDDRVRINFTFFDLFNEVVR